jgi:hypothetical protein
MDKIVRNGRLCGHLHTKRLKGETDGQVAATCARASRNALAARPCRLALLQPQHDPEGYRRASRRQPLDRDPHAGRGAQAGRGADHHQSDAGRVHGAGTDAGGALRAGRGDCRAGRGRCAADGARCGRRARAFSVGCHHRRCGRRRGLGAHAERLASDLLSEPPRGRAGRVAAWRSRGYDGHQSCRIFMAHGKPAGRRLSAVPRAPAGRLRRHQATPDRALRARSVDGPRQPS